MLRKQKRQARFHQTRKKNKCFTDGFLHKAKKHPEHITKLTQNKEIQIIKNETERDHQQPWQRRRSFSSSLAVGVKLRA
jgi:hypothetical protein